MRYKIELEVEAWVGETWDDRYYGRIEAAGDYINGTRPFSTSDFSLNRPQWSR